MIRSYFKFGLRKNPFVTEALPGVIDELFIERGFPDTPKAAQNTFVQIIGEKGAGKTSLLLYWRKQLSGPYTHVPRGIKRYRWLPTRSISYWDEADRIPKLLLWVYLKISCMKKATIVAGTHVDLSGIANRTGKQVITFRFGNITAEELEQWVERRIRYYSYDTATLTPPKDLIQQVAELSGGSWAKAGDMMHIWTSDVVNAECG